MKDYSKKDPKYSNSSREPVNQAMADRPLSVSSPIPTFLTNRTVWVGSAELPPEVAAPYEYVSELNGPLAVDLKIAVRERDRYLGGDPVAKAIEYSDGVPGMVWSVISAVLAGVMYYLGAVLYTDNPSTAFTLVSVIVFLAFGISLCVLFGKYLEWEGFGIIVGIAGTIAYTKFVDKPLALPIVLGVCLILFIVFLIKRVTAPIGPRKEIERQKQNVEAKADAMFEAFRQRMYDFAGDWDGASPEVRRIRKAKADECSARMDEVRRSIVDWSLARRDWKYELTPSWFSGALASRMKSSPPQKKWMNVSPEVYRRLLADWDMKVPAGKPEILELFRRNAREGLVGAMTALAIYYHNENETKNDVLAFFWAEAAARGFRAESDGGDYFLEDTPHALYVLAFAYCAGIGVEKNDTVGRELMRKASAFGSDSAKKWLQENR